MRASIVACTLVLLTWAYADTNIFQELPEVLSRGASEQHNATVIFLHGLGQTGDGWEQWVESSNPQIKWLFPTAPMRSITALGPTPRPAWFDFFSWGNFLDQQDDVEGLTNAAGYVQSLVNEEAAAGIPSQRVVIVGFSQGGALALSMLREPVSLGGIVALATFLPRAADAPLLSPEQDATPVFMVHGSDDDVVDIGVGIQSFELLEQAGANVTFKEYDGMGHEVHARAMQDAMDFIEEQLLQDS